MNPVALITGASRGIGRGIALELAKLGYDLVINFANNRAAARQTAADCVGSAKTDDQKIENGVMIWATRIGKLGNAPYMDIQTLANETGGELLTDKPENLNTTFQTLMDHLRSRYNLAFVSSNKKRDGTTRKLKIDLSAPVQKSQGKLVVKARRSYVAPRR